jgi:anti-anti-sigma regulatory factor
MNITLSGDCTLTRSGEIARDLLGAVASGESLVLHLDAVTQADLSFYQLLAALNASCRKRGIALELASTLPTPLAVAAARCGIMACAHTDAGGACR